MREADTAYLQLDMYNDVQLSLGKSSNGLERLGNTCPSHTAVLSPSLLFTTEEKSIVAASQRKTQYTMHAIKDITTLIDSAGAGKLPCVLSIVLSNLLNTTDKSNVLSM
jgi:hypothetical protein